MSGMWLGVAPISDTKKTCVFKEIGLRVQHDNYFRFNSLNDWRDLYDCLMSTRIFTLIMDEIFIPTQEFTRKVAIDLGVLTILHWSRQTHFHNTP